MNNNTIMKSTFPIIILLIVFSNNAFSQSYSAYSTKAEQAVKDGNYTAALSYYHFLVTEAGRESMENFHQAAESARRIKVYDLAERYYQRVAEMEKGTTAHPLTYYWLADVEKRQGKYTEAKEHFEIYLTESSGANAFYAQKARKEIADCEWAVVLKPEEVEINHMETPVNSEMTDLAPIKRDGKLYFTSIRDKNRNTDLEKEQGSIWIQRMNHDTKGVEDIALTSVWVSEKGDKKNSKVSEFDAFREDSLHVAHIAFANDGNRVVYSLCKQVSITETECKLYYRDQDANGKWNTKTALPDHINLNGYTTTQPAIGKDKATGKNLLFFVSDRPDGQGQMDIWCSYLNEDNTFDEPINLSSITSGLNTSENDITPFWDEKTQTLYFSSEGHQNIGSHDIYKVKKTATGWSVPKHMGYPVNSSYDDIYYSISDEGNEAFFSSNRPGSLCASGDSICVCSDIYSMNIPVTLRLEVLTYNSITKAPLNATMVNLENINAKLRESESAPDTSNYFTFDIDYEFEYGLFATKDGYSNGVDNFSTNFERTDTTIRVPLYLTPKVDLNTFTFDKRTNEPLSGVKVDVILIPKTAVIGSEDLATTNAYNFGLDYYNQYMVVATKAGYTSDTVYVRTDNIPIEPKTLEGKLYLCKGLDPFPDITLYFDNDYPNPNTEKTITEFTYGETAQAYLDRKTEFLKPYRNQEQINEVTAFFDGEVKRGLDQLDEFAQRIYNYFASIDDPNSRVKITILGNASTKSNPSYNFNLTKRRVSSLRNHLREWTNGRQSMANFYHRIDVTEKPLGDTRARTAQTTPIVDLAACRERRVDILEVRVTNECGSDQPNNELPKPGSPLTLKVLTFDELTGKELIGTTVEFFSTLDPVSTQTKDDTNAYYYDISRQTLYNLKATKAGYTTATKTHYSDDGNTNPQEVRLYLRPTSPAPGELKLRVRTYHELTGEPLSGASVKVAAGIDNDIDLEKAVNDYTYLYGAKWKTSYQIEGTKPGYSVSRKDLYTQENTMLVDDAVEIELYLRPVVDLTAWTYDRNSGAQLSGVKVDLIQLPQKSVFSSQSEMDAFKYLYKIDFKQSYMVVASKPGYTTDTTYVSTTDIPMVPTNLETKLYLCKALDLSPNISLYFDNDHPDPDCERVTTALTYKQTCDAYLANRKYFEDKLAANDEGLNQMQSFFDNDVAQGMARLDAFAQDLYNYFAAADGATNIEITIRGYASLRSNPTYNLALTKRRISSMENYLRTWTKGTQSLAPYYNRIKITEVPKGDQEACVGCYEKSSIKDLQACKDRRVDIISARVMGSCGTKNQKPGDY
jgi:outer membrane protein OmpA-like peptidoglycan-associated protein